jgi:hypothetical protein
VLHGEEIEGKARLDAVEVENKRVIQFATDDGSLGSRLLVRVGAQTVNDRRIRDKVKGYFVFLVLRRGNARLQLKTSIRPGYRSRMARSAAAQI